MTCPPIPFPPICYTILENFNESWTESTTTFHQITVGMSNTVYKVTHDNGSIVLLRIYGDTVDPEKQSLIKEIGDLGIGPSIYYDCPEGSVEQWFPHRQMTRTEMRTPTVYRKIAKAMKRMHDQGFTHNDLHYNNMLVTADDEIVCLDFEFTKRTMDNDDKYFDIVNFFCEWTIDYCRDDWGTLQFEQFPSKEHQQEFCEHYFGHPVTNDLLEQISGFEGTSHLFWMGWALGRYDVTGDTEYLTFMQSRAKGLENSYKMSG